MRGVGTRICNICWQYQPFRIVSLFLTDNTTVSRILVLSSILYHSKKWFRETFKLSFV